jgi:hypothetical protein
MRSKHFPHASVKETSHEIRKEVVGNNRSLSTISWLQQSVQSISADPDKVQLTADEFEHDAKTVVWHTAECGSKHDQDPYLHK